MENEMETGIIQQFEESVCKKYNLRFEQGLWQVMIETLYNRYMTQVSMYIYIYMGGCQNYGLLLDPYYNTAPNIQGTQKGTIILTTTHIYIYIHTCVGIMLPSQELSI